MCKAVWETGKKKPSSSYRMERMGDRYPFFNSLHKQGVDDYHMNEYGKRPSVLNHRKLSEGLGTAVE